jgi:hypothetical protein
MNKPFQPRDPLDGLSPLPDVWAKLRIIAENKGPEHSAKAMKLFADLRAADHPDPYHALTSLINRELRQRNADHQFDKDRERDEQGLAAGEKL